MTNKQRIKTYSSEVQDLIYNFNPAWKYLGAEQQKVISEFKQRILKLIQEAE